MDEIPSTMGLMKPPNSSVSLSSRPLPAPQALAASDIFYFFFLAPIFFPIFEYVSGSHVVCGDDYVLCYGILFRPPTSQSFNTLPRDKDPHNNRMYWSNR